jgi:hypothetical protein
MKNNSNIDKITKDILKQSYVEISYPDFNQAVMKKVSRESRKQRIVQNLLLCFSVFVAVDSLILLVYWLLGLNIFNIAINPESIYQSSYSFIDSVKESILQSKYFVYIFILIFMLAIINMIIEPIFRPFHKKK